MSDVKISEEVQEVIDYILEHEPELKFKICPDCGRNLPGHDWFYQSVKNHKGKYVYEGKCKECRSLSYSNGTYKFYDMLDKYWYYYFLDEIEQLSRVMSDEQLAKYYNKNIYIIEHVLYKVLKTNQIQRNDSLNKNEIIQIYNYLLNKERKFAPKGFFNNDHYVKVILEHLITNILKWNKKEYVNNFKTSILNKYGLYTMRKTRSSEEILEIIKSIFDWDIKIWEMKKTHAGDGFWLIKNNVDDVLLWFKNKLLNDKNICNIYDAYEYGLVRAVSEYYLKGLLKIAYKNNLFKLYSDMYNEEFDLDYYNKNYHCFQINPVPVSLKNNNIIYKLTDKYYLLDDLGKTLINEVVKYCETNNTFPTNHDLNVANGYISFAHIKEYFKKYSNIYQYILPLEDNVNNCWNVKENRINYVKYYCEEKCKKSILTVINSTELLRNWVYKFFNQNIIRHEMSWANDYVPQLYDLLISAYPEIKENKILFDWEWISFYPKNNRRIEILRELVFYRLNNLIINIEEDIPKYLNFSFMDTIYPKFNTMIRKGKFKNYYEWACLSFPEYKDKWSEKDFGMIVSKDNTVLSSFQEKQVYEFIKYELNYKYIKYIGSNRKSKYTYSLESISEDYKKTCPDYVIEYIIYNNKKIKLYKPIIIEYYGYYYPNNSYHIFTEYIKKMKVKNKFYNSLNSIIFIDLYPEDLKNNLQGVRDKLLNVINSLELVA